MPNIIPDQQINKGYFFTSDDGVNYNRLTIPYLPVPEDLILEYGEFNNQRFYRLLEFESEEVLALMKLLPETVHTHDYWTIKKVSALIKRNGYGTILYKAAILNNDTAILSDRTQTLPGSVNIWKNLYSDWHSRHKEISVLNSRNGQIIPYTAQIPDYDIWGYDADILHEIIADEETLQSMYDYESISYELFTFLNNNLENISDKRHIRLIGQTV